MRASLPVFESQSRVGIAHQRMPTTVRSRARRMARPSGVSYHDMIAPQTRAVVPAGAMRARRYVPFQRQAVLASINTTLMVVVCLRAIGAISDFPVTGVNAYRASEST